MIEFTVIGRPQPAGSKRAFAIRRGGELTGRIAIADANPRQKDWQQEVRSTADAVFNREHGPTGLSEYVELMGRPIALDVTFVLARPKGHYGTGRNAETVKPSAPQHPTSKPDTTKLLRAVEDALTGVLWRDDAQVVEQRARKVYGWPERCEIAVRAAT